jgi:FAD/FMN-containing dehydrogenase
MNDAHNDIRHILRAQLGHNAVLDGTDAGAYLTDIKGVISPALAVVRPANTAEVAQVVRLCGANDVAIIAQGGNTNVCGMTMAPDSRLAVVLCLSRMNHIVAVDADCSTLIAEAGCTIQACQEAAAYQSRLFAPDWGARGTAQVGGAVATNGGGLNVFRYGTTREQVLGVEAVLADGTVWDGMRALRKDTSGYDLKQLLIGSEGTLGIITKVVFKLHPQQPHSRSMFAAIETPTCLMAVLNEAKDIAGDTLVAFELMNGVGVELALKRYPNLQRPIETRSRWYVLVRLAGRESVDDTLTTLFERTFGSGHLTDAVMAQSESQEHNLWALRDQMIPMQYFPGPVAKWDVSVPINKIATFLYRAESIANKHDPNAVSYAVGHVGDGNIHYSIFPQRDPGPCTEALLAAYISEIDALTWSLGGSIVAEHGVGTVYIDRMRAQKPPVEYAMMQQVKRMFDPANLMNPGKLLRLDS